jgi:hypothetical protein
LCECQVASGSIWISGYPDLSLSCGSCVSDIVHRIELAKLAGVFLQQFGQIHQG